MVLRAIGWLSMCWTFLRNDCYNPSGFRFGPRVSFSTTTPTLTIADPFGRLTLNPITSSPATADVRLSRARFNAASSVLRARRTRVKLGRTKPDVSRTESAEFRVIYEWPARRFSPVGGSVDLPFRQHKLLNDTKFYFIAKKSIKLDFLRSVRVVTRVPKYSKYPIVIPFGLSLL